MSDIFLHIDEYFTGNPSVALKKEFENKIAEDPAFANEVAFYLSAKETLKSQIREIRKEKFGDVYQQYKQADRSPKTVAIRRRLMPYIAAAAIIIALVIGWVFFTSSRSPKELADRYLKENYSQLGVTMSTKTDSIQAGISLYNTGKLTDALNQFESIVNRDKSSPEVIKYAGLAGLQLEDYNKALKYFKELENWPGLQVNYGKLFHALTLMKRGYPDDMKTAKELLQEIDQKNLDGKTQARVWLRKF
jgi:tetratricopeptide (TPR) repeat protein